MLRKLTVTTALVAVGVMTSLSYPAVAQRNRPLDQANPADPTEPPPTQPNRPLDRTNPADQPAIQPNSAKLSAVDEQFMSKAAQGGIAEVELSQLAAQKAASNDVKQYAQQMIQDHTQANDRLSQLAQQKGVTLPTEMDAQHQELRAQLEKMSGTSFDRAYLKAMEADHQQTVALFQSQAKQGRDPALKTFATNTLPTLQEHWRMVRAMTGNSAAQNRNSPSQ